ncbi:dienelactone hydrolase family protein [Paenibacillus eucommiae]|uniref:Dienelactone hydrolase n=1 Tax=Paenibacillus eucommiae TaxID=1355755 RepID=A0ABS4IW01_9BACL|nr:alpha/beta fold hydrolase [Paenibacillus eucommiae]MBP1991757.1 dienelactone hydrolase [Paenibacillus eucommiae]
MSHYYSMGEYLKEKYKETARPFSFSADNKEDWEQWKHQFTEKLYELLGEWPAKIVDPRPLVLEKVRYEGYICEKVMIHSEENMQVPFYFLIPDSDNPKAIARSRNGKLPAVLCMHGHGGGKDDVADIQHGERQREVAYKMHNYNMAPALAREGYIAIVPDARGFGERNLGYGKPHAGGEKDGCDLVFLKSIMLGINPLTLNIWDAMRCVDYLESRDEVDMERVGCIGLSFGGAWALYTSILDDRIRTAVISGYFNSFESHAIQWGNFCGSMTIPHLLKYGEMADLAALLAPKPVLLTSGKHDMGFPYEASEQAYETVKRAYTAAGCEEKTKFDGFEGGHQFNVPTTLDWLNQWL